MTKDEILQALRLTAMGRANTPLQDELAERLAQVFAVQPQAVPMDDCGELTVPEPKRSPGRPKKAD